MAMIEQRNADFCRSEEFTTVGRDAAKISGLAASLRLTRATLLLSTIVVSYFFQRGLARVSRSAWVAARWDRVHARNAQRLYRGICRLRGIYVKFGQLLSTMDAFVPAPYVARLRELQDRVPPRSFDEVSATVTEQLGAPLSLKFASFSREPVASASLGQVHRAVTHDGQDVAVKVLYRDIDRIMAVDLKVLGWALVVYRWFVPMGQLDRLHEQLSDMLARETDLRHEARCLRVMRGHFANDTSVIVPNVIARLSSDKVMTMSYVDGVRLTDHDAVAATDCDQAAVAKKIVEVFFKQVIDDEFVHADPHPGNFLLCPSPSGDGSFKLAILDLGSATHVRTSLVDGMMQILRGFMAKDDAAVIAGIRAMGFVRKSADAAADEASDALVEQTIRTYFQKLLTAQDQDWNQLSREDAKQLLDPELQRRELRQLMRAVEYPEGWLFIERAALLTLGTASQLDKNVDVMKAGFPWIARRAMRAAA